MLSNLIKIKDFIETKKLEDEAEKKRRFILVKAQVISFFEDMDNITDEINIPTFQRDDVKEFLQEIIDNNQIDKKYRLMVKSGLIA